LAYGAIGSNGAIKMPDGESVEYKYLPCEFKFALDKVTMESQTWRKRT